jgi:hypothetical protein
VRYYSLFGAPAGCAGEVSGAGAAATGTAASGDADSAAIRFVLLTDGAATADTASAAVRFALVADFWNGTARAPLVFWVGPGDWALSVMGALSDVE